MAMAHNTSLVVTVLLVLATCDLAITERILILTPAPSYSHQIVFRSVCRALHARGHELVVLTPNPIHDPSLNNYTEIDFGGEYKRLDETDFSQTKWNLTSLGGLKTRLLELGHIIVEDIFEHADMKKHYANGTNAHFDAVIVEMIMTPALYGFAHRFNAPLIGIMSMDLQSSHRFVLGSPLLPSHFSNWELETMVGANLPFWRRVKNYVSTWWSIYSWVTGFSQRQQALARKYLGDDLPHINDLAKNMSLVLINQEAPIAYARPELPNVVHFSGLHIAKKPPVLPKNLKVFLDSATNGFIYLSFGTNVKSHLLPKETLQTFIRVFSKLPYKVLWKFDKADIDVSDNVLISKWVPQQGVLAHPNIKLFIYQGGLQSTEEAVHYAIPLIGIPFVFDQAYQVAKMASLGVAIELDIVTVTEESLHGAIEELILNKKYKEKMQKLSILTKDKPFDSLKNAAWWIEYVMRHRGAPHLRFTMVDDPWYQRFDMDIIAFLSIAAFLLTILLAIIVIRVVSYALRHVQARSLKAEKQKAY